ncbi:MAG TPA: tetratricopeptide repeat protein [Thermoanaerobaculia bacterium]|nr:tetratricopeptide repeat protein [Thermoanaerobaculia bacterium]
MRKATLLSLILLLPAVSLHAATATEYATQARAALGRRDFEKSVELAEKAIALEPRNAEHHYLLGAAYGELAQKAGKLKQVSLAKKTKATFEPAVELDPPKFGEPGHAGAWSALGLIQEKQGKKAEAKASYTNALKIVPGDKGLIEALKRVS